MEETTQLTEGKKEDSVISIVWKPDAIVNITMTGKEFEEYQKALAFLTQISQRAVEDNLNVGVFKYLKESDTSKNEKGELTIREDFWN